MAALVTRLTFVTEQPGRLGRCDSFFEFFDFQSDWFFHVVHFLSFKNDWRR